MKIKRFNDLGMTSESKKTDKVEVGDDLYIKDFDETGVITHRDDKLTKFTVDGKGRSVHSYITDHFDYLMDKGRISITKKNKG
jgi:hypothetical protein